MGVTQNFRSQHDAVIVLAEQIDGASDALCRSPDRDAAKAIGKLLGELTDLLNDHFDREDRLLYPRLMALPDTHVAATARSFFHEMGDIGPDYARFAERWSAPNAIVQEPELFRAQSRDMFDALSIRIAHENEELYPLAEWALGDGSEEAPDDAGPETPTA